MKVEDYSQNHEPNNDVNCAHVVELYLYARTGTM